LIFSAVINTNCTPIAKAALDSAAAHTASSPHGINSYLVKLILVLLLISILAKPSSLLPTSTLQRIWGASKNALYKFTGVMSRYIL